MKVFMILGAAFLVVALGFITALIISLIQEKKHKDDYYDHYDK